MKSLIKTKRDSQVQHQLRSMRIREKSGSSQSYNCANPSATTLQPVKQTTETVQKKTLHTVSTQTMRTVSTQTEPVYVGGNDNAVGLQDNKSVQTENDMAQSKQGPQNKRRKRKTRCLLRGGVKQNAKSHLQSNGHLNMNIFNRNMLNVLIFLLLLAFGISLPLTSVSSDQSDGKLPSPMMAHRSSRFDSRCRYSTLEVLFDHGTRLPLHLFSESQPAIKASKVTENISETSIKVSKATEVFDKYGKQRRENQYGKGIRERSPKEQLGWNRTHTALKGTTGTISKVQQSSKCTTQAVCHKVLRPYTDVEVLNKNNTKPCTVWIFVQEYPIYPE